jgi:hypothetical protein
MATQLQIRRGTSSQVAAFTGAEGEVVVNTTNDSIHVNDGSTAGGFEMARVDGSNWAITNNISTTANISFGDNDKAIFGAGSDLQIYHDGANSYVKDNGVGDLIIQAYDDIKFQQSTDNADLVTINTGGNVTIHGGNLDVTGTATMDGLTVDSTTGFSWLPVSTAGAKVGAIGTGTGLIINTPSVNASFGSGLAIDGSYASDLSSVNVKAFGPKFSSYGSKLNLFTSNGTSLLKRQTIASNGDISFYEDTGTTPKLFWDASAESLGIGTSSLSEKLTIAGDVQIGESSGGEKLKFVGASSKYNFLVGKQVNVDNAFEITPSTAAGGTTFSTPAVVVNSSGNVGIGVISPAQTLHLKSADPVIRLEDSNPDGIYAQIDGAGGSLILSADQGNGSANSNIVFKSDNSERMRIDASGNLALGDSNAYTHRLFVKGVGTNEAVGLAVGTNGNNIIRFYNSSLGTAGAIRVNSGGTTVAYNTSSDRRLKENITDADDAGSKVDAIQVRKFDWIADGSHQDYGMIAQELQSVAPEAVSGDADSDEMMGVDYSKLVPMLVKEIQSLRARVAQLEK